MRCSGHQEVSGDARSPETLGKGCVDRSSARILYHPPAKRSPVPTRLTPRQLPGHSSTSFNSPHIAKAPRTPPRLSCPRGKTGLAGGPAGWLTEQRADEDDNLHGGCELAVQLRLAQLPERAEVGASLGTRRVARVAGVRRHPAVVVPHSEAGGLRSPARPRSPAHKPLLARARRERRAGAKQRPAEPGGRLAPHVCS